MTLAHVPTAGVVKVIKRDGEMVDGQIVAPTELVRGPA
jgi:hypothetical protein